MKKFTNPLAGVKVASPCPANWNEMPGDERKRYCSDCKLNVYNLSEMTRREAENFIINAEGRVCVKFYRRADGSVLTKDCPIGWQAVKRRISRAAQAFASVCAGILGGIFAFNQFQPKQNIQSENVMPVSTIDISLPPNEVEDSTNLRVILPDAKIERSSSKMDVDFVLGKMVYIPEESLPKKEINSRKNRR